MATLLLVDDEPAILKLCQTILKLGGHEVLPAGNGDEALRLLEKTTVPIDLALLDVMMPTMNGIELANRIQNIHPATRIVLMTGFGPEEISRVAGPTNPYKIILKPFKSASLLRMVENALEGFTSTTV